MKAYEHLIRYALANGATVSVYDGEIWEVKRSTDYQTIADCIESVDEAQLNIRDKEGNPLGWAHVSAYGLADDETVIDFRPNEYMKTWEAAYDAAESVAATLDTADLQRAAQALRTGTLGVFAAAFGDAATRADSHNLKRLAAAFPELFAAAQTTTA